MAKPKETKKDLMTQFFNLYVKMDDRLDRIFKRLKAIEDVLINILNKYKEIAEFEKKFLDPSKKKKS